MLKMYAKSASPDEPDILVLGLSFGNLERFRAQPLDTFIPIQVADLGGPPLKVVILSGRTEAEMADAMKDLIGPETAVTVSDRLKS